MFSNLQPACFDQDPRFSKGRAYFARGFYSSGSGLSWGVRIHQFGLCSSLLQIKYFAILWQKQNGKTASELPLAKSVSHSSWDMLPVKVLEAENVRLWCSKWFFGLIWQLLLLLCQASLTFSAILFLQESPFPVALLPSLFMSSKSLLLVRVVLHVILELKLLLLFHRNGVSGEKGKPRYRRERRLGKDSPFADGGCYSCTKWHMVLGSRWLLGIPKGPLCSYRTSTTGLMQTYGFQVSPQHLCRLNIQNYISKDFSCPSE